MAEPERDGIPRLVPKEAARMLALSIFALLLVAFSFVTRVQWTSGVAPWPGCNNGAHRELATGDVVCGDPQSDAEALTASELFLVGTRLDVNAARAIDLELIPGVGPKLALRIVEHRSVHGAFLRIEDLEQVVGVGPQLLATMRGYVRVRAR